MPWNFVRKLFDGAVSAKRAISPPVSLPRNHYIHLRAMADARREEMTDTANFLIEFGEFTEENTLHDRYGSDSAERLDIPGTTPERLDEELLVQALQACPGWIKPKTDFPRTTEYSFSLTEDGVQSVSIGGRTFYDRTPVGPREEGMYPRVKDRFPKPMTLDEYRALSFCQSQYSILLEEQDAYVMPREGEVCVDAGSFVGYKAMAMADIVGPTGAVYAIEIDPSSYELQQRCFEINEVTDFVHGVRCALAAEDDVKKVYTTVKGSMGNSLIAFDGMGANLLESETQTKRLDTVLRDAGIDYVDNLHVSVNGYESEVLAGLGDYAQKVGTYCVMAPYSIGGESTVDKVLEFFNSNNIKVWGRSQAAIVAGPEAGRFTVYDI